MVALSDPLMKRCRETLLSCNLCHSATQLEPVFNVGELSEYRFRIPRGARDAQDQVNQTINFLLETYAHKRQLLFLVFLKNLLLGGYINKNDDLYTKLGRLSIDVEIEDLLYQGEDAREKGYPVELDASRHDPKGVEKLVQHLLGCPHMSNRNERKNMLRKLPEEIVENIRSDKQDSDNEQDSDFADVLHMLEACNFYPHGVGELAYALYQLEGESPAWQALDEFLRDLYKTNVTFARLRQLQSILLKMTWHGAFLRQAYIASMSEGAEAPTDNVLSMLDKLAKARQKDAIVKFVEHLAHYAEQQQKRDVRDDLKDWSSRRANELGIRADQSSTLSTEVKNELLPQQSQPEIEPEEKRKIKKEGEIPDEKKLTRQQVRVCISANKHYMKVKALFEAVKVSGKFFDKPLDEIYPRKCEDMLNALLSLSKAVRAFIEFLDHARLPSSVQLLRLSLVQNLGEINSLLSELKVLKKEFCPKSQGLAIQQQQIQQKIKQISKCLKSITALMASFNEIIGPLEEEIETFVTG